MKPKFSLNLDLVSVHTNSSPPLSKNVVPFQSCTTRSYKVERQDRAILNTIESLDKEDIKRFIQKQKAAIRPATGHKNMIYKAGKLMNRAVESAQKNYETLSEQRIQSMQLNPKNLSSIAKDNIVSDQPQLSFSRFKVKHITPLTSRHEKHNHPVKLTKTPNVQALRVFSKDVETPQPQPFEIQDAPNEIFRRQLEIKKETDRKGLKEELKALVDLQMKMLTRSRDQQSPIDLNNQMRRQAIYKNIYENVKKLSADEHQEQKKEIDLKIKNFIENNLQQTELEEQENKPRGRSLNVNKGRKYSKLLSSQTRKQLEELQKQSEPRTETSSLTPRATDSVPQIPLFKSPKRVVNIEEVRESQENSPVKQRRKSSLSSSNITDSSKESHKSPQSISQIYTSDKLNLDFQRKDSLVLKNISRKPSLFRRFTVTNLMSPELAKKRKSVLHHKQIDQELLHILITRWKKGTNGSPTSFQRSNKKLLSQFLSQEVILKRKRRRKIAQTLLVWLQRMIRCKVILNQNPNLQITLRTMKHIEMPSKPFQNDGSYVLFKAIKFNNFDRVKQLLDFNLKLLWEYNQLGQNCLHIAAKRGHYDILRYLLDRGADYEQKDFAGRTPLYYATHGDHIDCFKELANTGAEPWGISSNDQQLQYWLKQLKKHHYRCILSGLQHLQVQETTFLSTRQSKYGNEQQLVKCIQ